MLVCHSLDLKANFFGSEDFDDNNIDPILWDAQIFYADRFVARPMRGEFSILSFSGDQLQWRTAAGVHYGVFWSENVTTWYDFGLQFAGDGNVATFSCGHPQVLKRFYRVGIVSAE